MLRRWQGEGSSPSELIKLRKKLSKLDRKLTRLKFKLAEVPRGMTLWFNIQKQIDKFDEERKITRLRIKGYDV